MDIYTLLTILPFAVFIYLLMFRRLSLLVSTIVIFSLTFVFSILFWNLSLAQIFIAFGKGYKTAFDILLIILGALFFLNLLRGHHIIEHLTLYLESFSADYRVQTIILAWFLMNFLEGVAGFGTPAAVVAPILVTLGISPFTSIILCLFGNSISGAFGAAGTPITVGFPGLNLPFLATQTVIFSWPAMVIPAIMLWIVVRFRQRPISDFISALPFALWSGFVYISCTLLISFFRQELVTILGSILSLLIIFLSIKCNLFTPPKVIKFSRDKDLKLRPVHLVKVISPYLVFIFLIAAFHLNPGVSFLSTSLIFCLIWQVSLSKLVSYFKPALKSALEPFLIILLMSTLVQILSLSGMLSTLITPIISFGVKTFAPIIGTFGAFITGSTTVSNILFGQLLYQTSLTANINPVIVLSLQLVGAALGSMIALADMVAAEAVIGLKNQESQIVKTLLPYCLFLITLVILLSYVLT